MFWRLCFLSDGGMFFLVFDDFFAARQPLVTLYRNIQFSC